MKLHNIILSSIFALVGLTSIDTQAAGIPITCSWVQTSIQSSAQGAIITTNCVEAGVVRATKTQGYGAYSSTCMVTTKAGYTSDGGCAATRILKIIPEPNYCPVATDGCSTDRDLGDINIDAAWVFPELNYYNDLFKNACNKHDTCYGTLGQTKATCDTNFRRDMKNKCSDKFDKEAWEPAYLEYKLLKEQCKDVADAYYTAVNSKSVAGEAYAAAQNKTLACQSK